MQTLQKNLRPSASGNPSSPESIVLRPASAYNVEPDSRPCAAVRRAFDAVAPEEFTGLWDLLYRIAYAAVGNVQDAEDVVQTAFTKPCPESVESARSWLVVVVRTEAVLLHRKRKRLTTQLGHRTDLDLVNHPGELPDNSISAETELLQAAIRSLRDDLRSILELSLKNYNINALAREFGYHRNTVSRKLKIASNRIRVWMIAHLDEYEKKS